MKREEFIKEA